MKLYEFPPTRSIRVRWALQELGVPFDAEIVDMTAGAHRSPEDRLPEEVALARRDFCDMAAILENHLKGREYLLGPAFCAADIVCGYTLDWANEIDLLASLSNSKSYMERLCQRPRAPLRIAAAFASLDLAP